MLYENLVMSIIAIIYFKQAAVEHSAKTL